MGKLGVILNSPTLQQTQFTVTSVSANQISIAYQTLPGNMPNQYGNFAAIWQNTGTIPWNEQPLAQATPSGNTQAGSFSMDGLELQMKSYIVGFATGPNLSNICATAVIPVGGGTKIACTPMNLSITDLETDSIVVSYTLPGGQRPETNKHWIGLWRGGYVPFDGSQMLAQQPVTNDNDEATQSINGLTLTMGTTYTLAYFTGKAATSMAALLTFTT